MALLMSELCLGGGDLRHEMQKQQETAEGGRGEPIWDAHLGQEHSLAQRCHPQSEMIQMVGCLVLVSCSMV